MEHGEEFEPFLSYLYFQITFSDPTPTASMTVTSNADLVCPNSVLTTSGTNPITFTFNWVVPPGYTGQNIITFKVENDICPVPGVSYSAFNIYVLLEFLDFSFLIHLFLS